MQSLGGCHKKSDAALCHKSCLEEYIETRRQSERDHVSDTAGKCPNCNQPFRVKLKWRSLYISRCFVQNSIRWSNARYLSSTSISQYFNFTMIVFSSLSFFYAVYRVTRTDEIQGNRERYMVWAMVALIASMGMLVIWTVYKRWKRHQMDAELVEIV